MTTLSSSPRVFGVDYNFLSCGEVFTQGLVHAAEALGVHYEHADWADPRLHGKVEAFNPDLIFVVHGRRYHRLFRFPDRRSAVWLLDEPYEVDDTSRWSYLFQHVFVNDPGTVQRHRHASYLPVCYDPIVHYPDTSGDKILGVGFIGGGNGTRERYLSALERAGMLHCLVGGPWKSPVLQRLCSALTIPASETAVMYRLMRIVVNVFRERHHYNRQQIQATSMNPRIYEALACGALVISEWRQEIAALVPDLPTFRSEEECIEKVSYYLNHPVDADRVQRQCAARLQDHTYAHRLQTVLQTCGLMEAAA